MKPSIHVNIAGSVIATLGRREFFIGKDILCPHFSDPGPLQRELSHYFSNIISRKFEQPEQLQGFTEQECYAIRDAIAAHFGLPGSKAS